MPKVKRIIKLSPRSTEETLTEAADRKVLAALGEQHLSGNTESPRSLVAFLSGYGHPNCYMFLKSVRRLRKKGMVKQHQGTVRLTEAGIQALPSGLAPLTNNGDVHKRLIIVLQESIDTTNLHRFWGVLEDGKAHDIDKISETAGWQEDNSSIGDIVRKLTSLGLVTVCDGLVQLADITFPLGRP